MPRARRRCRGRGYGSTRPRARAGGRSRSANHPKLALFAPGAPFSGVPSLRLDTDSWSWSHDGRAIVYERKGELVRRELASGAERVVARVSDIGDVAESSDGRTVFYVARLPHVKRMAITNFGDRPPF